MVLTLERHAFRQFESELKTLLSTLAKMNTLIGTQIETIEKALGNSAAFSEAKQVDKEINQLEFDAERIVTNILSMYSPTGDELRFVITSLKISTAMELMGDMAKNSIKHVGKLQGLDEQYSTGLRKLAAHVRGTVSGILGMIEHYDEKEAEKLFTAAQQTDTDAKNFVLSLGGAALDMEVKRHLMLVAKNLERISDHGADIVKYCYYIHTGKKHEKPVL